MKNRIIDPARPGLPRPVLLIPFAALCLAFAVSCSGSREDGCLIGVSQCSDDAWREQMNREIRREALFYPGVEVEIRSAYDDNARQIADIGYFTDRKVDLLVVAPNEAGPVSQAVEAAFAEGIPVILVDRTISSQKYTAFIGADNYDIGWQIGHYLADIASGKVIELTGLSGSSPAIGRSKGFADALKNAGNIEIAASVDAGWSETRAAALTDSLLAVFPDVEAVFAHNDRMAASARKVAGERGKDDIVIIGIDAMPGQGNGIEMVLDGTLTASFIYPTGGDRLVQLAMKILEGKDFKRTNILGTALVDSTNARILQMQSVSLEALDSKVRILQGKVDEYFTVTSLQKMFLTACFIIVILLSVLLAVTAVLLGNNRRAKAKLEEMNGKLEEATNAKLSFFTNVSHDFRTPLTLVADPVNQLIRSGNLGEKERFLINIAHKNVTILLRLVNQILDFRKFESGKLTLSLTRFDLAAALKDWMSAFDSIARVKRIDFSLTADGPDGGFTLVADREKVERIVYNLLSNAFKFTEANGSGRISVTLSAKNENEVEIDVQDNGTGISAAHINNIFNSFYQADVHHSGSGIGLMLSKAFAELHGGTLSVSSAEGKGSVFRLTLPVSQPGECLQDAGEPEDRMIKFRDGAVYDASRESLSTGLFSDEEILEAKKTVLVIDDNLDVRSYLKSILSYEYNILEASNGAEGIRLAGKYVPDAIICDVMMPGMDGMECCRILKSKINTSHIPVLMLTAYAAEEQKIKGYECGADSYISKPFSADLLTARLGNLIGSRQMLASVFGDSAAGVSGVTEVDRDFIDKLKDIINSRLSDPALSVEAIGEEIGLSRVQLYRKTKSLIGYSPNEFLRICRLRKAASLLSSTGMSVSEAAYAVGFSTPSYFTKCYREYFGETPASRNK